MRKLIFILLALLPLSLMAQSKKKPVAAKPKPVEILPIDSISKKVSYSGTETLEGRLKDNIYNRVQTLVGDPGLILKNDKNGTFKYKGTIAVQYPSPMIGIQHKGVVSYTVTVTFADGTYTYVISDFEHKGSQGNEANGGHLESKLPECDKYILTPAGWQAIKLQTKDASEKLVESLKTTMKLP